MTVGERESTSFFEMIGCRHVVPVTIAGRRDTSRRKGKYAIVWLGFAASSASIRVGIYKDPE
jgi:hypothetical protein